MPRATTGIYQRHGRTCNGRKDCGCPWQASVYSKTDGKKVRKQFPSQAAAKAWRADATTLVHRRLLQGPTSITVSEAAKAWLEGARAGLIRTRSGDPYKPAAIRAYEAAMRLRVDDKLGHRKLGDVTRRELQDYVDELLAGGLNPSTITVTLLPLRAIYRRALARGELSINPTTGLEMPAVRGRRDRIAPPDECARLLEAVDANDRALWATAMYAGLRRGELMALRIEDVDLAAGVIHVRRGWDYYEGEIKTKNGKDRKVPIPAALRVHLAAQLLGLAWREGLVFGATADRPIRDTALLVRAKRAWNAAGLAPINMHECRHTFASLMIAAGVNAKALSSYMGHHTVAFTLDRYGHLMPGNEDEAASLLDAYLGRAASA